MTTITTITTPRLLTAVVYTAAVMPVLRWLILRHSAAPGQPWRIACDCGNPLWPNACGPGGRCRTCGNRLGPPGFLIEATTITTAVAAVLPAPGLWQAAGALWWAAGAVVLAAVDVSVRRLPHRISAATAAGFLGLLALAGDAPALARAIIAATLGVSLFTGAALLGRGQVGGGDIGFAAPVSAFLAAHSWMTLLHGYLEGFAAAVAFFVAARVIRRPQPTVPLAPFLLVGALIAVHS